MIDSRNFAGAVLSAPAAADCFGGCGGRWIQIEITFANSDRQFRPADNSHFEVSKTPCFCDLGIRLPRQQVISRRFFHRGRESLLQIVCVEDRLAAGVDCERVQAVLRGRQFAVFDG